MVETVELTKMPVIEVDIVVNNIVEILHNMTVYNISETFESIESIRHSLNSEKEELEILKRLMSIGEL